MLLGRLMDFSPIDWGKVKKSIGSESTISLRLFILFALFSLPISIVIERKSLEVPGNIARLLIANTCGFVLMWIFWFSARKIMEITDRKIHSWMPFFLLSGFGGLVQGITAGWVIRLLHVHDFYSINTRAVTVFFLTLFWLPLELLITTSIDSFARMEQAIFDEIVIAEKLKLLQSDIITVIDNSVEEGLKTELRISADRTRRELQRLSQQKTWESPNPLARLASGDIHHLATRLWYNAQDLRYEDPSTRKITNRPWRALLVGTDVEPFNLLFMLLIGLSTCGTIFIRNLGVRTGMLALLFAAFPLLATAALSQVIFWRTRVHGRYIFLIWATATFLILIFERSQRSFYYNLLGIPSAHSKGLFLGLPLFVLFIGIQVLINLAKGSYLSHESALQVFAIDVSLDAVRKNVINAEVAKVSKSWARRLHGRVQSDLSGTSLLLEEAHESGDPGAMSMGLAEAYERLDSLMDAPSPIHRTVEEEIEFRIQLWQALTEITYDLTNFSKLPNLFKIEDLGEVLEEAIANAVRHASAKHVSVVLRNQKNGSLLIEVSNDGEWNGIQRNRLGTEIFSIHTEGKWSLDRAAGSDITLLKLVID